MTLDAAMQLVESHEFDARLSVSSDLRTFLQAAQRTTAVRALFRELRANGSLRRVVVRVIQLARQRVDPRYENKWDTALAVYVWVISLVDINLAKVAAEATALAPQCWWANKIAQSLLLEDRLQTDAQYEVNYLDPRAQRGVVTQTSEAGKSLLPSGFVLSVPGRIADAEFQTSIVSLRRVLTSSDWFHKGRLYTTSSDDSTTKTIAA